MSRFEIEAIVERSSNRRISERRFSPALAVLSGVLLVVALTACRGEFGTPQAPGPALLEAHGVEPYLVGNLLFIAHWDEDVLHWLVHDVAGHFTPDQPAPPPGVTIPPNPGIGILNGMERGKLYDFHMRSDQIVKIVEGGTGDWYFNAGANFLKWRPSMLRTFKLRPTLNELDDCRGTADAAKGGRAAV